jgi:PrtD family type I secretion system ABC transporter
MNFLFAPLRGPLAHVALFSFVLNLLLLVPALFMLQVFDRVLTSQSRETLTMLLLGAALALGFVLALDYLRARLQGVAGAMVTEALAPIVAKTLIAARAGGGTSSSEGLRDVATLRALFSAQGLLAMFDAPWLLVYVAVIGLFHPTLGVAAATAAVAMLAVAWLTDRWTRAGIESLQRQAAASMRYLESSLNAAEAVHTLGMTESLLDRWRAMNREVSQLQNPVARRTVAMAALTRTLRQAIQVIVLAIGASLVIANEATMGVMMATTILLGRALAPVEQVVGSWRILAEGRSAFGRLRSLLLEAAEPDRMRLPSPRGALEAQNVSFRAPTGDALILQGVSLRLAAGESLAVVGPSAAGKSTLLRVLIGLWTPTAGVVRLDGADISQWPRQALGPSIGYLPQRVELFEGTVAENIARLGAVDPEAVVRAAQRARVHEMILALPESYETRVDDGPKLSPGQRQRIGLARALYGEPRIVLLDEPNANLDGASEQALSESLTDLHREGVTVVLVTHRNTLLKNATQVLVLQAGRVQHYGPTAQVLAALEPNSSRPVSTRIVPMSAQAEPTRRGQAS